MLLSCLNTWLWWGFATAVAAAGEKRFTNMWLAEIHGGEAVAENIARSEHFTFNGQASDFENHYVLLKDDQPEYSELHSDHLTRNLLNYPEVKWAKQQTLVERHLDGTPNQEWSQQYEDAAEAKLMKFLITQADKVGVSDGRSFFSRLVYPTELMNFLRSIGDRNVKTLGSYSTDPMDESFLSQTSRVTKNVNLLSRKLSAYALEHKDPLWRKQWYLQDYRTSKMPVMDHNVVPVWKMGHKGVGVTVAILDEGVQHDHPDLKSNFRADLSYDVCKNAPGSVPDKKTIPGTWMAWRSTTVSNPHGTSCAGVVAMEPDNNICGVGIAYKAKIVGIKMICDKATEYAEAKALKHQVQKVDIYSGSWTPPILGYHLCTLDHMAELAYIEGTTKGRGGKGSIYVQSTGNGRNLGNNCAANCFINNPYVIGITSVNQVGKIPFYSDSCPAIFAAAYSGDRNMEGVVTLNADSGCRDFFSGTSAATPVAAGIFALVLSANSKLTYRDVMHLIAMSAEVAPLADNKSNWYQNERGFWVSNDFGFGLLNAKNMVSQALKWTNVPEKHTCVVSVKFQTPVTFMPGTQPVGATYETDACEGTTNAVRYLEHVEVTAEVEYPYRGGLAVFLESPSETKSYLLQPRPNDELNNDGLKGWNLMSLHTWGEDPRGAWTLHVAAVAFPYSDPAKGFIHGFTLKLHGTATKPSHYDHPRIYAAFRLRDGTTSSQNKK